MTGKAYSIKEMKSIVDYLIEHKAYGEIKGRKMWIDFANSQVTNRTWQSLKETFLKRIMPDIHNPYYKLTIEQINSFRQGYDVVERNKNKLDIQTVSEDSTSSGCNADTQKQPETVNVKEDDKPAGEDIKCSKIPMQSRSSAETVILDKCYETPEDIQRDLESPVQVNEEEQKLIAARSLRDCITYSEPLTPMVQEVLDDFASEPEDEPQMVIDESTVTNTDNTDKPNRESKTTSKSLKSDNKIATDVAKNAKGLSSCIVEEVLLSEIKEFDNQTSRNKHIKNTEKPVTESKQPENIDSNIDKEKEGDSIEKETNAESSDITAISTANEVINLVTDDSNNKDSSSLIDKTNNKGTPEKGSQNCSNTTPDSLLPNNPEGLEKSISNVSETQNKDDGSVIELSEDVAKSSATRKRTISQDTAKEIENKKKKTKDDITTEIKEMNPKEPVDETKLDKDTNEVTKRKKSTEKQQEKTNLDTIEKPSTSKDVNSHLPAVKAAEIENPCLKNVSLFDEQFNNMKYDTSETSEVEELAPNKQPTIEKQEGKNKDLGDVLMLKSHSDTESHEQEPHKEKPKPHGLSKKQRDKALSNVFGFSSGPAKSHRKRRLSRHKKSTSHNVTHDQNEPGSSDWTSETDSELYVSPPRARKNRQTKKYLKPVSARIMSLEEEGGLFVMYGKKIFPLVKDGKIVKNYLTYSPSDSEEEEDESYWKLKYVEEKKKSDELKKLLQEAKEPKPRESNSPILQPKSSRCSRTSHNTNQQISENSGKELCVSGQGQKQEVNTNVSQEKIKIRFTKKDEEVHLEGHWPQIHPVLAQVVQIFHQESESTVSTKSKMIVEPAESKTVSRCSTPAIITAIDPEVHERVNEIENEIFKEIEARDKEENSTESKVENNVTKRKVGRPRLSSTSSQSPNKRPRRPAAKATTEITPKPVAETENTVASVGTATRVSTRRSNNLPARKVLNESANTNETKTIRTRSSRNKSEKSVEDVKDDDDDVRYMLPPHTKRTARSASNTRTKEQKTLKSIQNVGKVFTSPTNFSLNSLDSTQGYQDSDISPARNETRKKKLISRSTYALRNKSEYHRNVRRRSHPYLCCEASNDSTNSMARAPLKIMSQNSSLNSEAYKSESYQLLMPQVRRSFRSLERIDEAAPIESNNLLAVGHMNSDVASSSNISLPLSPELSIVENLSVSKDMLNHNQQHPTLNETQFSEMNEVQICNKNKYMISRVDVSMPLMQQDCGIEICNADTLENSLTEPVTVVTESLLDKISTVNLGDQAPMTETLNQKLRNLLLESAKKVGCDSIEVNNNMMEVDNTEMLTKAGNKKRCSTPRKRKGTKKSSAPKIARLVEERVESCSFGGRKSCPPVVQDYLFDENALDEEIANLTVTNDANVKRKGRLKKDVIKVKILRPTSKNAKEKTTLKNASKLSVYTDSGINDSGSGVFIPVNDSVDLIHNHSETCLHANECCGDSVQFIDNAKSAISIDSNSAPSNEWQSQLEYTDAELKNNLPECFCSNAQDVKSFYNEAKASNIEDGSDTVYLSPAGTVLSYNSLITEDLSDETEPPDCPTKWYLLSEEETMNTNMTTNKSTSNTSSFGANLKQIFPVTYAVPNLSTISEMSKDNDSRKPTLETDAADTVDDLFGQFV